LRIEAAAPADDLLPWLKDYPAGIDWHLTLPEMPLPYLFRVSAARFPDAPCLDFLSKRWTYGRVSQLVSRAAKGLAALGVTKGKRVALLLPNTPYYVILYYAVLEAGGTLVNVNPLYTPAEIRHLVQDSGAELVATLDLKAVYDKAAPLADGTARLIVCRMAEILRLATRVPFTLLKRGDRGRVPHDDRHIDFAALVDNDGRFVPPEIEPAADVALLQYTGGTTGTPKGAMLTHANLIANALQCLHWYKGMMPAQERFIGVLPFFHVFAMTAVLNVGIAAAAEITLMPRFTLDDLLATIRRKRPTTLAGVPTLFSAIANDPRARQIDLSSIHFAISGGAPLPVEIKAKFEALTGCTLVEGYGLSETSPVLACNPIAATNKPGSVGVPVPRTMIRILSTDDPANVMAIGERGEIAVKGPQVMAGYWNNPVETAANLKDGWFRTGDIGYLDQDGYLFIVDRIKDVIIAGGYKIYPRNVEEAIYQHPAVAECIVIGVDDPYRGQTVKAYVALAVGQTLDEATLLAFLKDKLSPIEMPKQIEFRASLPKTLIGKPSKVALLEEERRRAAGKG
jgi:long-chain acyl-CoA synthetase